MCCQQTTILFVAARSTRVVSVKEKMFKCFNQQAKNQPITITKEYQRKEITLKKDKTKNQR